MSILGALGDMAPGLIKGGFDILGGQLQAAQNRQAQRANFDFQRDVLKNSIQWRMQDAAKAHIHPLAALGMMPVSGSPVVVGGEPLESSMSQAGQSFGTAVSRGLSIGERAMEEAQLAQTNALTDKYSAEAFQARTQAALAAQASMQPPSPLGPQVEMIPGQNPSIPFERAGGGLDLRMNWPRAGDGMFNLTAPPRMSTKGDNPGIEAGFAPDLMEARTESGFPYLTFATAGQESHHEVQGEKSWLSHLGLLLRNQAYWSKRGYDNWWMDMLRVQGGYDPVGPGKDGPSTMAKPLGTEFFNKLIVPKFERFLGEARRYKRRFNKSEPEIPRGRR